jgi:predicted PurR-regulated permease PerM
MLTKSAVRSEAAVARDDDAVPPAGESRWRLAVDSATLGIFTLLFVAFLHLGRAFFLPVMAAMIIGMMLSPVARRAETWRVPAVPFALVVVLLIVGALNALTMLLAGPVASLIEQGPQLGQMVREKFSVFASSFEALRHLHDAITPSGDAGLKLDLATVLQSTLSFLTPAIGEIMVFLATLFLFLVSRDTLRRGVILLFPDQETRLAAIRIFNDVEQKLTRYIGAVTAINLSLGVVTAVLAWAVGLPNPILFGALAFVCNYVPYIGPGVTLLTLFVVGFIVFPTLGQALLAPALFLGVTTIEGQFLMPHIVGRSITVNPLAVFLSLVFWMWLWGPIGGFLSVPILIIGLAVMAHVGPSSDPELPG